MCTGLELGPALMGAGAVSSAFGAANNSSASKAAYGAQAQVNRNNAQIAEWQAGDALVRGQRAAAGVRMKANQLKGNQRASMAANGVDLGVGSALNILSDTDYFKDVDAGTTLDNAAKEAWAIRNQAAGYTAEANLMQGRSDAENPLFAGATSLLTSAGKVAGSWYTPGATGASVRKTVPDYPGAEY